MSDLIERLQKGDRDAFNELVLQYEKQIINLAYGMLSDREDALDAAQEVFIKVYRNISGFKGQSSLTTWMYRITSNVCNDILRKRQRTLKTISIHQSDDEETPTVDIPDTSQSPQELLEQTEAQKAVRDTISTLSDDFREVLTLCDIDGQSYESAAQILGIPHGTVKSRLNRARNALRKKLSEKRELF